MTLSVYLRSWGTHNPHRRLGESSSVMAGPVTTEIARRSMPQDWRSSPSIAQGVAATRGVIASLWSRRVEGRRRRATQPEEVGARCP